jgi:hemerythrin-like domain-containing protein
MATKKKATAKKPADAVTLLKQDHEVVRELLGQFETATGARREKLRGKIEHELKVHTTIEEEIFYPAYREASRKKDDKKLYFEALEEHHVVDMVLPEMNDGDSPEELKAKAKVLKDLVEHHAEEEEKEMFPRARKVMSKEELRDLGAQMEQRKAELS